ncbi:TraB/GumN family protein [Sphingomonas sp.]|uniref:TraB/GumN family protein n=1 Tax=Sphingomonas sp. TaxID=28214 RepID=UPI001B079566|nr:TraB/GumN family protein [Sphingomonas sp.]MBO9712922.1 TraB/GumN family protein [Sphingomonas sp.]
MIRMLCGVIAALVVACASISAAAPPKADPALWMVKDGDTTIYLFGTVHVMKPGVEWMDDTVKSAFDSSGELMLETVEPPPAELQAIVMKLAVRSDGRTLTETLPEARRAQLATVLAGYGMPANGLDRFEPWFASVIVSGMALPRLGYDPTIGADRVLAERARSEGKVLTGFEAPAEQLGYFDASSEEAQIAYLGTLLDDMDRIGPVSARILELWSAGQPDALGDAMNAEMSRTPALFKRLIADRNVRWASWIEQRMAKPGVVFVAVGAGHLGGAGNVRELLAAHGLKAVRVH